MRHIIMNNIHNMVQLSRLARRRSPAPIRQAACRRIDLNAGVMKPIARFSPRTALDLKDTLRDVQFKAQEGRGCP